MTTGKVKWFIDVPGTNSTPCIMKLEVNGANIPITDNCGGFQQFLNAMASYPGYDGEGIGSPNTGGPAPNGNNGSLVFLGAPVYMPPMEQGRCVIGGLSLAIAHTQSFGLLIDSAMSFDFEFLGGQFILGQFGLNQTGILFQPSHPLPVDPNGPCIGTSRFRFPSIVAWPGQHQVLVHFDQSYAPTGGNEFHFIEPNGGDYGLAIQGAGHGFFENFISALDVHGQEVGCIDIGHGQNVVGGGNIIRASVAPNNTATGLDYWGNGDIVDIQITAGDNGNGLRGIVLEGGSYNLQCRVGQNVSPNPIVQGPGAGHPKPNVINGVSYQN